MALVRPALADDLDGLIAADHLAASADADRIGFISSAVAAGICLVLVDRNVVAGYVVTRPRHFFGRDFVELLMVHPGRRRTGAGRLLLRTAVKTAETSIVFTSTNRSNVPMRGLLVSEGWTFSGELSGLDEGETELVFFTQHQ